MITLLRHMGHYTFITAGTLGVIVVGFALLTLVIVFFLAIVEIWRMIFIPTIIRSLFDTFFFFA